MNVSSLTGNVIFLDCQTTGMHPSNGRLLEMSWSSSDGLDNSPVKSFLLKQPLEFEIPKRIETITGISADTLKDAVCPKLVFDEFQSFIASFTNSPIVVAHYSQFEKSFLQEFYKEQTGSSQLNFELICSQKIARRIYPHLPSQNLRALAGYFGLDISELKRAHHHVIATSLIWKKLLMELKNETVEDITSLNKWLSTKPSTTVNYEYRINRLTRLQFPSEPGIYRMMGKEENILYIGKAKSLRDRVNSYFRGQKNRNRRVLEMLTRVWDVQYTICETHLEAELLESDEIKKHHPPYNIKLRAQDRNLVFYSKDLQTKAFHQCADFPVGPFTSNNAIDNLLGIFQWLHHTIDKPHYFDEFSLELLEQGIFLFCKRHDLSIEEVKQLSARQLLLIGTNLLRRFEKSTGLDFESYWKKRKAKQAIEIITDDTIADKFEKVFIRAAIAKRRCRWLTKLLNAKVFINENRYIQIKVNNPSSSQYQWEKATISDLDKVSILLASVNLNDHKIVNQS